MATTKPYNERIKTKPSIWTKDEDNELRAGRIPATKTTKQANNRRYVLGITCSRSEANKVYDWTPEMDLAVVDPLTGKYPKNWESNELVNFIPRSTRIARHQYLRRNYIEVGWGSLIGTQKIYTCSDGEEE